MNPAPFTLGPALLFCPGDRPDRFAKALDRADAVVLDLEDGVAPDRKEAARQAVVDTPLDPARTIVRVNPAGTPDHDADLAALARTGYRTLMLPKADGRFVGPLVRSDGTPYAVVALCETAAGVLAAPALAARPDVVALAWGADDLVASLGGTASRRADGEYRDVARHARSAVLIAAGAAGKAAIDAVHLDLTDLDGLRAEALDAAAVGFAASLCVHPSQVPVIRAAYVPGDDAVAEARAVLAAARRTPGAFALDGRMVDGPVLKQAHAVLRRAGLDARLDEEVRP
ncbi:HpcH/HpaI aldolase [Xylanimonas cellulosilytica DSM 15894]|uniref:HpcH/HpaI aldolase n=1 Tax=Xylanimonas cellulosilytica (strain DSM 15894 / JCM 12276 / CECT 5975 / KCTC 9989 / LMG 20990 / NBRC 107835 / XIL07) TaxID=446471 RepID=D1BUA9_XYLCX|nr:CoA ester lyase [Xylanimonas cellulosilytica]ACZ31122.1 HpcH/HpaI aldolase [Xylanimonas cellulosilytica DSM 15894]